MMKRIFTFSFLLLVFSFFNNTNLYAQPINDAPCDAIALTLDAPPTILNNKDATTSAEEAAIVPPTGSFDAFNSCIGGWCDDTGVDGGAGIDHSVWFKFIAPTDKAVLIDICGSTFDSQLALYQVGDCGDYETYTYIYSSDDQNGCGSFPNPDPEGPNPLNGLASTIRIECLNAGEEYYILVDAWQSTAGTGNIEGDVVIQLFAQDEINGAGVSIATPVINPPTCPGESTGFIDLSIINGIEPISYIWSNDSTTQDITNISAGTYTVTLTDFCGNTADYEFEVVDPDMSDPITLSNNAFTDAFACLRQGSVSLAIETGTPPFTYEWNDGNTSAMRDTLPDGVYTVTITDACISGGSTLVQEFVVKTPGPDAIPGAGLDTIKTNSTCAPIKIGLENDFGAETAFRITDNPDQIQTGGVACLDPNNDAFGDNRYWRTFNLKNYDIPVTATLVGVEVFVRSVANTLADGVNVPFEPGLKGRFYIGYPNTLELDDPELQLEPIDSLDVWFPTNERYESYFAPFVNADDVSNDDEIVVSLELFGNSAARHLFRVGFNQAPVENDAITYFSATNCGGVDGIVTFESIGFPGMQVIMNLVWTQNGKYTYEWEGDVDDPTAATPTALGTGPETYSVTITGPCGEETTDKVTVDCWTVGTEELVEASFSINPNPSTGVFQLENEGPSRDMLIQVFDLHGKSVYLEKTNIGSSATSSLDLSHLAKGIYLAKLSNEEAVESYRLVIQ